MPSSLIAINEYECTVNNNSDNILLSLDYLKEEAKKDGHEGLYKIIKTALTLGHAAAVDSKSFKDIDYDNDTRAVITFLLQFLNSSEKTQQEFLSLFPNDTLK